MIYRFVLRLCLVACCALTGIAADAQPVALGHTAPNWILPTPSGEPLSFYQDSESQPSVLLFWATWCPFCQKLMPELEVLRRSLKQAPVRFYALNIWENGDSVNHMRKHDFGFTQLLRADMVAERYGVIGTPGLFVVGSDKKVRYIRSKGTSTKEVIVAVKRALAQ